MNSLEKKLVEAQGKLSKASSESEKKKLQKTIDELEKTLQDPPRNKRLEELDKLDEKDDEAEENEVVRTMDDRSPPHLSHHALFSILLDL